MRPRSVVQALTLYNDVNEGGEPIPRRFDVNSWVTLQPEKRGGHSKDARKHGGNNIHGAYKARILKFVFAEGKCSEVVVQHAYQYRQLHLDPNLPSPVLASGVNCK